MAEARAVEDSLQPGSMVGEFRIGDKIGQGGMGVVYAGQHPVIGKRVAVKVLSSACASNPDLVRRFIEEARAVNKIGHPNIIDIFSFGQVPDGRQYFVMEFLDGQSLADRLERGDIERTELRRLLRQICGALEAAHREGIIHRDLKPENIWVAAPKGEEAYAKLLDFGIAKLVDLDTARITQTGATMGSPQFMPPEQCMGHQVDRRADIYSMGVILYRIFTGMLPFQGRSLAELVYQQTTQKPVPPSRHRPVDRDIERIILDCLQKEPERRPRTARELGERLERAFSGMKAQPTAPMWASRSTNAAAAMGTTLPRLTDGEAESSGIGERVAASERSISGGASARLPRYLGKRVLLVGGGVLVVSAGVFVVSRVGSRSALPPPGRPVVTLAEKSKEPLAAPRPEAIPTPLSAPSLLQSFPDVKAEPSPASSVPKPDVAVRIRSVPPGARVVDAADGSVLGKTPIELMRRRGSGSLSVTLELKGWKPIKVGVPLEDDFEQSYTLDKIVVPVREQTIPVPLVQIPRSDPPKTSEPMRKQAIPASPTPSLQAAPGKPPSLLVPPPAPSAPKPPKRRPLRI